MRSKTRAWVLAAVAALALAAVYPIASADDGRTGEEVPGTPTSSSESTSSAEVGTDDRDIKTRDILHLDDVIINGGSLCVGFDCVNGESFGFDTIRLKENNLRINFLDTSTSASFPPNDWRIVINDTTNGGASYFAIEDSSAARQVFRVAAGARANALTVDSGGDVGIGILNAVVDLHIKTGNTPTMRLDQDGTSGFTPQVWDVAGNEANFFVRDATNGSTLPFKIKPGAPSDQLVVTSTGVGIGTVSPAEKLHIKNTATQIKFLLENSVQQWSFTVASDGSMRISVQGTGGPELEILPDGTVKMGAGGADHLVLDPSGNATLAGNLTVSGGGGCTGC